MLAKRLWTLLAGVVTGTLAGAGFMRGIPHEYVAYNMSPDESWERLAEAYELIVKAWTEPGPFAFEVLRRFDPCAYLSVL